MFRRKRKERKLPNEQTAFEALQRLLKEKFPDETYSDYPSSNSHDYATALGQLLEDEQRKGTTIGRSLTQEGLRNCLSISRYTAREEQRGIDN